MSNWKTIEFLSIFVSFNFFSGSVTPLFGLKVDQSIAVEKRQLTAT